MTSRMPRTAGTMSSHANTASERTTGRKAARVRLRPALSMPRASGAPVLSAPIPELAPLGERLLELGQVLQALRHRQAAADDVLDDRDGFGVVLAIPRLLVGRDDLALLVLGLQELQVDPVIVGLHHLGVVVHLGIRVVEARDQAPLPLDV